LQLPEMSRSDECSHLDAGPDVMHGLRVVMLGGQVAAALRAVPAGAPGWLGYCRRHGGLPNRYRRAVDPVPTFTIHLVTCGGIASSG